MASVDDAEGSRRDTPLRVIAHGSDEFENRQIGLLRPRFATRYRCCRDNVCRQTRLLKQNFIEFCLLGGILSLKNLGKDVVNGLDRPTYSPTLVVLVVVIKGPGAYRPVRRALSGTVTATKLATEDELKAVWEKMTYETCSEEDNNRDTEIISERQLQQQRWRCAPDLYQSRLLKPGMLRR